MSETTKCVEKQHVSAQKDAGETYDRFIACGDWHANATWAQYAITRIGELVNNRTHLSATTTADTEKVHNGISPVVYHVGDFGVWGGREGTDYLLNVHQSLEQENLILRVILGNHENYDLLEDLLEPRHLGFNILPDFPRIEFSNRANIWIDEHTNLRFGSIGGGGSVDRNLRVEKETWWSQEEITQNDYDNYVRLLKDKKLSTVDVFLSHEAPSGINMGRKSQAMWVTPEIVYYCDKQRMLLRDAVDMSTPGLIVHGHWHRYNNSLLEGIDFNGKPYQAKTVGLDMDSTVNNIGVFTMMGEYFAEKDNATRLLELTFPLARKGY